MVGINNNGKSVGVSSGTSTKDVYTPSFCGESSPVNVNLEPTAYTSMINPPSFGFEHHSNYLKEQATATDFVYNPELIKVNGQLIADLKTASNEYIFPASELIVDGRFSPIYCDEDRRIEQFKAVCENDNTVSYSKPEKEGGLVIGPQKKAKFHYSMTELPTKYVTPILADEGPINTFGIRLSRVANVEQDFRNLMFDDTHRERFNKSIIAYFDYLNSIGYDNPRHLLGIGTEIDKRNLAAHYHEEGHSVITASTDLYEKAKEIAEKHGLKGPESAKFVKEYIYFHELFHLFDREAGSKVDKEIRVGEHLHKFFKNGAKLVTGTKLSKIYSVLAQESKDYVDCVRSGKILTNSRLESLIVKYKAEAERLGIEDVEEYVSGKLEKGLEKVEKDNSKRSGLEEKLKENREKSEKEETNPDEKETYEGKEEVEKTQENYESGETDTVEAQAEEASE